MVEPGYELRPVRPHDPPIGRFARILLLPSQTQFPCSAPPQAPRAPRKHHTCCVLLKVSIRISDLLYCEALEGRDALRLTSNSLEFSVNAQWIDTWTQANYKLQLPLSHPEESVVVLGLPPWSCMWLWPMVHTSSPKCTRAVTIPRPMPARYLPAFHSFKQLVSMLVVSHLCLVCWLDPSLLWKTFHIDFKL